MNSILHACINFCFVFFLVTATKGGEEGKFSRPVQKKQHLVIWNRNKVYLCLFCVDHHFSESHLSASGVHTSWVLVRTLNFEAQPTITKKRNSMDSTQYSALTVPPDEWDVHRNLKTTDFYYLLCYCF